MWTPFFDKDTQSYILTRPCPDANNEFEAFSEDGYLPTHGISLKDISDRFDAFSRSGQYVPWKHRVITGNYYLKLHGSLPTSPLWWGYQIKQNLPPVPPTKQQAIVFAPYAMGTSSPVSSLKAVSLAFANTGPSRQAFFDCGSFSSDFLAPMEKIYISIGGQAGNDARTEPALAGPPSLSPEELCSRYEAILNLVPRQCRGLDLDIETGHESESWSFRLRNKALKLFQQRHPEIELSYTLPADPSGVVGSLPLLRDAAEQGLKLHCVRIMTFDFGNGSGNYPRDIQACLESTYKQVQSLSLSCQGIGCILMIKKDDLGRFLSLDDTRKVTEFCKGTNWINYIGFWHVGADTDRTYIQAISSILN